MKRKKIAKESFSPVNKKVDCNKMIPHYKDECWSNDLLDQSSLSNYSKYFNFIFTIIDNHSEHAWAILLKDNS